MTGGPVGGERGFTLVEMIVALALFALISLAALALVETVMTVQRRTERRLDRIAELDRALYLIGADFTAVVDGPSLYGPAVGFRRTARGGPVLVGYAVLGGTLMRSRGLQPYPLVTGVERARWRFHRPNGWQAEPSRGGQAGRPDTVELTLTLRPQDGLAGGTVRRVMPLPAVP